MRLRERRKKPKYYSFNRKKTTAKPKAEPYEHLPIFLLYVSLSEPPSAVSFFSFLFFFFAFAFLSPQYFRRRFPDGAWRERSRRRRLARGHGPAGLPLQAALPVGPLQQKQQSELLLHFPVLVAGVPLQRAREMEQKQVI